MVKLSPSGMLWWNRWWRHGRWKRAAVAEFNWNVIRGKTLTFYPNQEGRAPTGGNQFIWIMMRFHHHRVRSCYGFGQIGRCRKDENNERDVWHKGVRGRERDKETKDTEKIDGQIMVLESRVEGSLYSAIRISKKPKICYPLGQYPEYRSFASNFWAKSSLW